MEGFISFLVIFILVMWALRRLLPLLFAWAVKRKMKKMQQGEDSGSGNFHAFGGNGFSGFWSTGFGNAAGARDEGEAERKEEGKVTVTGTQTKDKVIKKEIGEYIDFEEK